MDRLVFLLCAGFAINLAFPSKTSVFASDSYDSSKYVLDGVPTHSCIEMRFARNQMNIQIGRNQSNHLLIGPVHSSSSQLDENSQMISLSFKFEPAKFSPGKPGALIGDLPNFTVNLTPPTTSILRLKFEVGALRAGQLFVRVNSTDSQLCNMATVLQINTVHSEALQTFCAVIGWIYFAAWTISFYPQIWLNFTRKSVVGLNFDYASLNVFGFAVYTVFNFCMYFSSYIKKLYFEEHRNAVINPVRINDLAFSAHAVVICCVIIFQCFIYERGSQHVSRVCIGLLTLFASYIALLTVLTATLHTHTSKLSWLAYLNYVAYVKLAITIIKYIPQAVMNYRRKSTDGWSIVNILLDFTGGSMSILQMLLLSYNSNDWQSIFGDWTKFGLGLFSVLFDVLFIVQHYVLYRNPPGKSPFSASVIPVVLPGSDDGNRHGCDEDCASTNTMRVVI